MLTTRERRGVWSAVLSFVLPGLGHLTSGRTRAGLKLAAPLAVLLVIGLTAFAMGAVRVRYLLDAGILAGLLVASLFVFGWRLLAVLAAYRLHARWSAPGAAVVVVLVVLVAATQWIPTQYLLRVGGVLERISDQEGSDDDRLLGAVPSALPSIDGEGAVAPSPTETLEAAATPPPAATATRTSRPQATPTPKPTPTVEPTPMPTQSPEADVRLEERVTVLLLGTDALEGRDHRLTDTMMVASLGARDRHPVMVSVPRDLYGVPLPDGRIYNAKLNSLAAYARARPDEFPLGGVATLRETIELLLGLEIDYVAAVDMRGLIDIVDAIGGVVVPVQEAIDDPSYPAPDGSRGFRIESGRHHMDGETALAYARSRKGAGDDDFERARRQQRLVSAIRTRIDEIGLPAALPILLEAVDEHVRTDVPRDRIGHLAEAVLDARWEASERLVLDPPEYVTPFIAESGAYGLRPDLDRIRNDIAAMLES